MHYKSAQTLRMDNIFWLKAPKKYFTSESQEHLNAATNIAGIAIW
jgi:hypothetical protein